MPSFVHFEIPADDVGRARDFYAGLFDWQIEKAPGPIDYWFVRTTNADGTAGLAGGMMARQHPMQQIINYVQVEDLDAYAEKVTAAGGQIAVPRTEVPGMGHFVVCLDTEANCFAMWQPLAT